MKFQALAIAAIAATASAADSSSADDLGITDYGQFYSSYYSELSKLASQLTTGYYGAINSFYGRSDVASAINGLTTISGDSQYISYLESFNSKYWTELSSIYSVYSIDLNTDDSFLSSLTASASPAASATASGSSATATSGGSSSGGSSAAGSSSAGSSSAGSSSGSASSSSKASSTSASSSSKAAAANQQKPLLAFTGLIGALSVLIL